MRHWLRFVVLAVWGVAAYAQGPAKNVIFVMTDGLRWQEAFRGAEAELMTKDRGGVEDVEGLKKAFWRAEAGARREALMPFLATVMGRQGQVYGNRDRGSDAYVTNGLNFSYPGYNEMLTGFADPRIDSNDKKENPNVSVLEWLNGKPGFKGKIAAFTAWDTFPWILNVKRSGLLVNSGYSPLVLAKKNPRMDLINTLKVDTGMWDDEPFDGAVFQTALEYLKTEKPRVMYISFGETDEWSHGGRYDLYLKAAHRVDGWLRQLWETAQSMPEYRGKTVLIMGVDHGRGSEGRGWRDHGEKVPESKYVWMGFLGSGVAALGEREKVEAVTQSQVAATLAALLGEDYRGAQGKAGKVIEGVVGK